MKKKIIFIMGSLGNGGAERVISKLANYYCANNWEVHIVLLLNGKIEYDINENITIHHFYKDRQDYSLKQTLNWLLKLRSLFKDLKPEYIISFIARINLLTIIASFLLKNKIIISERNDPRYDGRSKYIKLLTYILYPFAHQIVFQTNYVKKQFPIYIQQKSTIILNPIKSQVLNSYQLNSRKIVTVGRLIEQKNHNLLIDAFKQFNEYNNEYSLHIYGEGHLKEVLQKKIHGLNLRNKIVLHGSTNKIHEHLKEAELFVLPSNYEGLSNALLEAMSFGIPCISTAVAGSTEIINGKNSVLIPIGDQRALVNELIKMANSPDKRIEISEEARKTSGTFSEDAIFKSWDNILR